MRNHCVSFSFDRTKSKSSPHLDEEETTHWRGLFSQFFDPFLHRFPYISRQTRADGSCRRTHTHTVFGLQPRVGVHVPSRSMSRRLLQEQVRSVRDYWPRNERAAAELERERRNIISVMRRAEPERGGPWPPREKKKTKNTPPWNQDQCSSSDQPS